MSKKSYLGSVVDNSSFAAPEKWCDISMSADAV